MFETYTERARRVIFFARYEVAQCGAAVETSHLLLGLLRENAPLISGFLRPPGTLESIRQQMVRLLAPGEKLSASVELPLSAPARKALAYARQEADDLSHKHLATPHILLGLLRVEDLTAMVLRDAGFAYGAVHEQAKKAGREWR